MNPTPNEARSASLRQLNAALRSRFSLFLEPLAESPGTRQVEAWFLGTKGENVDLFLKLVSEAITDQAFWRRNFHPGDPSHITSAIKRDPSYLEAVGRMEDEFRQLLAFLKKSVPFFSMRYQGHMNWDLTIPGMLGYFAAMMYNPNNVALEGSTATTLMELDLGDDLCRMLGYDVPKPDDTSGALRPWGHITCDGTVANIEALWSARNLKYFPLSLAEALRSENSLAAARGMEVPLPTGGSKALLDLNTWELLNLLPDDVLALPSRLEADFGISPATTAEAVGKYSLQQLGLIPFARRFLKDAAHDPVVTVPGTRHYSFPKAMAVLGLGSDQLIDITVDLEGRQSLDDLRTYLNECLDEKRAVISVVAVIGTTEESAIDPIKQIADLRDDFAALGLVFQLHADAAWGGYHCSVINPDFVFQTPATGFAAAAAGPAVPMTLSAYATEQLEALGLADSITVDPHKSGYIPYPAGALCYRNGAQRNLVSFSAPVVFRGNAEQTVGIFGIEGSKPGASVSAVFLSHKIIRPSVSGYGQIISRALYSCRRYYARLLTMAKEHDPFIVVPLPRLPDERAGKDATAQKEQVRTLVDQQTNDQIRQDKAALALLREIGPDQNILSYAFNFRRADGSINEDLNAANKLNLDLYSQLSIKFGDDIYGYRLLVSSTDIDASTYGDAFVEELKKRMRITSAGSKITVIRSVVMDPWITEVGGHSFVDVLESELRTALGRVLPAQPGMSRATAGY